jgi:hypothetical protein
MHRLAFVAVLLGVTVPLPVSVQAQEMKPYFQVQGGVNLSTVSHRIEGYEEDWIDDDFRIGYGFGGIIGLALVETGSLSLESGLLYQRKGGDSHLKYPLYGPRGDLAGWHCTELNWKFTYLTIPVLARATLGDCRTKPYIKIGPEVGILLSAKYERPGYPQYGEMDERVEEDVKDAITSVDFSLFLAGGVRFAVGSKVLLVELSYSHGLTDVYDPEDAYWEEEMMNGVIGLTMGIVL